jgi:hypothetical protein
MFDISRLMSASPAALLCIAIAITLIRHKHRL